jgi:uncharacterized protein YndB with AHSA1/START domain
MRHTFLTVKCCGALLANCFAFLSLVPATKAAAGSTELFERKQGVGRSIAFEVVVDGSPQQIFENWATGQGVLQFLGSGSRIEPRVGGSYEIDFGQSPDGTVLGPRGNRILRFEPGQALYFEWTMPIFAEELNTTPLPTWVEIHFEPFGSSEHQTLVKLSHLGFGQGKLWDRCHSFFERGWFEILFRLKLHRTYFVFSSS